MKLNEVDLIGKPTPSFERIMKKHGISRKQLTQQVNKGIEVELEHTSSRAAAREIALDHLDEFPNYYDRLKKAEI